MGPLDSRHGIVELGKEAGATPFFLLWAGLRAGDFCRVGTFYGRSGIRTHVHRSRGFAFGGSRACGAPRTPGRGPFSDVDVAAAEFARISGEDAGEYPEADVMDAFGGGSFAGGRIPPVVRRGGKL